MRYQLQEATISRRILPLLIVLAVALLPALGQDLDANGRPIPRMDANGIDSVKVLDDLFTEGVRTVCLRTVAGGGTVDWLWQIRVDPNVPARERRLAFEFHS